MAPFGQRAVLHLVGQQLQRRLVADPDLAYGQRFVARRHGDLAATCKPRNRRPLDEQGLQHHGKGNHEQRHCILDPGDHRHDGQRHRHGAAQTDPTDESQLVAAVVERQQAEQYRQRTRHQREEDTDEDCIARVFEHLAGCDQHAEHHEHARLRQPGHAVHDLEHVFGGVVALVAHEDAGDEDGEEAAAIEQVGDREDDHATREDEQRIHAFGQVELAHQRRQHPAARQTEQQAQPHLRAQQFAKRPGRGLLGLQQDADEGSHQQDGHRIVGARFDFQRRLHPLAQAHATVAQQREHRRSVGRTDDRSKQKAHRPRHVHQPGSEQAEEGDRRDHAEGRHHRRRFQGIAETADLGTQAAVEQDDRQRTLTDQAGDEEIIEGNAARPLLARQHADHQEQQQQGHAEARRQGARHHADEQQHGSEQEQGVDTGHDKYLRRRRDGKGK